MRHPKLSLSRLWGVFRRQRWVRLASPKYATPLVVVVACVGGYLIGAFAGVDRWLIDRRFELVSRPASGDLAVIEIDPRSLAELNTWPWPRTYYAQVINRLVDAGVTEIAVDIDFSARSRPAQDAALAAALERADGKVILPVFRQLASTDNHGRVAPIDTAPLEMFREHAQLGGVTLIPGPDGLVRATAATEARKGQARPTMSALLAGPAALEVGEYRIDFGIRPGTVPRYSFVDVLRGEVSTSALEGRKVIVGAAASELGDQHAVPVYRALYGPVLQTLAFESLVQGRALKLLSPERVVLVAVVLALALWSSVSRLSWRRGLAVAAGSATALEGVALGAQAFWPVLIPTGTWLVVIPVTYALNLLRSVELRDLQLFRQRIALNHRRTMMHRVMEDSQDGVVITDSHGNIEALNPAAATMLGIEQNKAVGSPVTRLLPDMHGLDTGVLSAGSSELPQNSAPAEHTLILPDGTPRVVEILVSHSVLRRSRHPKERRVRNRLVYSFTLRDVTQRAQTAAAQRKAIEEAEAANRAKSEFLANISHELRTPLNAIIGFSQMITTEALGPIQPPQYAAYVRDIEASGRHLLSTITDILDVSKIESGKFELNEEEIDLPDTLRSGIRIVHGWPEAGKRELVTSIDEDLPRVLADDRLIKQIVVNLLSNAIKYSDEGDSVTLRATRGSDGTIVVEVSDTGIGIGEEHLSELTKPFYQVDSRLARKYEGSGLGLSLVAAYVQAHDGTIDIESAPGVGTTFRMTFPAWRCKDTETAPAQVRHQGRRSA